LDAEQARLIQAYLQLFEYITHHGTYIDGFAAPQEYDHPEMWAAKLVLEMKPKWFRNFGFAISTRLASRRLNHCKVNMLPQGGGSTC
jgi:hypothetical protein